MTKDEALTMALEALENGKKVRAFEGGTKFQAPLEDAAIDAIKQALAQPEQEPVEDVVAYHSDGTRTVRIAPKRTWVGLTDEEILKFGSAANISHDKTVCDVTFARAIEATLKVKNT